MKITLIILSKATLTLPIKDAKPIHDTTRRVAHEGPWQPNGHGVWRLANSDHGPENDGGAEHLKRVVQTHFGDRDGNRPICLIG